MLDSGIEEPSTLGGFAPFSGAKFSLPPAGMGLVDTVSSPDSLFDIIREVLNLLELSDRLPEHSTDFPLSLDDTEITDSMYSRRYESIVLTIPEMRSLINSLSAKATIVSEIITAKCTSIRQCTNGWQVEFRHGEFLDRCISNAVFFAGGRLGSSLLGKAGAEETTAKGLDFGVRVEFPDKACLKRLRALGPDAKIVSNTCRTFCLNVPGRVHRYNFGNLQIPGGVVAVDTHPAGNVGLLFRSTNKQQLLETISRNATNILHSENLEFSVVGSFLGEAELVLEKLFEPSSLEALNAFANNLQSAGLLNWSDAHTIHLPLLDWHWPTYALPGTFHSSLPGLFVLGDSSGHARGLLQAAVSGKIAASEYLQ